MARGPQTLLALLVAPMLLGAPGCHLVLPETSHQPVLHNPFPQLSRVAVAPFFNQSDEPTVDGREFAMAYYAELQGIRGFEVVPVAVVEQAILRHAIDLSGPGEARRLAQELGVDAVVVGSVTDFSPFYPPRCGMRVEWYAANPGFHPIPAGYGLPWGTPDEEYIPEDLVFEAEMALAREQLATQTPDCYAAAAPIGLPPAPSAPLAPPTPPANARPLPRPGHDDEQPEELPPPPFATEDSSVRDAFEWRPDRSVDRADFQQTVDGGATVDGADASSGGGDSGVKTAASGLHGTIDAAGIPPEGWPDARGFTPPGPSPTRPACVPTLGPVMTHTQIYRGHDPDFTAALASYVGFRDDARFGGWQSYLERMDDFIRFCAHLHLAEMLTARGGGGETRVVRHWSESR